MRPGILRDDLPMLAGLVPPLLWLAGGDPWLAPRLLLSAAVVLAWQFLFARVRGQGLGLHALVTAGLIAVLVPGSAPHWQLVLGLSFGVVLGEGVFGGRGRNFVSPVALALAFLIFSFTDQPYRQAVELPLAVALPALALAVLAGQARIGTLLGAALGSAGLAWLSGAGDPAALLGGGAVVLCLAYVVADPVASGATPAGRWLHGILAGALAVLFATAGPFFGALVFAALLSSIFAPLIDHGVIAVHTRLNAARERRLRHG